MKDVTRLYGRTLRLGGLGIFALSLAIGCDGVNPNQRMMNNPAYYQTLYGRGGYPQYPSILPPQTTTSSAVRTPYGVGQYGGQYGAATPWSGGMGVPQGAVVGVCPPSQCCRTGGPYMIRDGKYVKSCTDARTTDGDGSTTPPADPAAAAAATRLEKLKAEEEATFHQDGDDWVLAKCKELLGDAATISKGQGDDYDFLPPECEDKLKSDQSYKALDKASYNGWKVSLVKLDEKKVREAAKSSDKSTWDKIVTAVGPLLGKNKLNEAITKVLLGTMTGDSGDGGAIKTLMGLGKRGFMDAGYVVSYTAPAAGAPKFAGKLVDTTVIRGGYAQPVLYNADNGAGGFSSAMLSGVFSNLSNLSDGDSFMYIAEAFIYVPDSTELHISSAAGTPNFREDSGIFLGLVDGQTRLNSITLHGTDGKLNGIPGQVSYTMDAGWHLIDVVLIAQNVKPADRAKLIAENVVMKYPDDKYGRLMQVIARPNAPTQGSDDYDSNIADSIEGFRILENVTLNTKPSTPPKTTVRTVAKGTGKDKK